jgi:hypothetical protein
MKTEKQLLVRLTEADYAVLQTVTEQTGATAQAVVRKLIAALAEYFQKHEQITFPITLVNRETHKIHTSIKSSKQRK